MTKLELSAALLERLHAPYDQTTDAEIATLPLLTVAQAADYLADLRRDEDAADLAPDERLPKEVTPLLYMEVYNSEIRRCRKAAQQTQPAKPAVTITFLLVEAGRTYDVTCTPDEVVQTIWLHLAPGTVLTDIKQKGVTP